MTIDPEDLPVAYQAETPPVGKVYVDELVGRPLLVRDGDGAVKVAVAFRSGDHDLILLMTRETAHALAHQL